MINVKLLFANSNKNVFIVIRKHVLVITCIIINEYLNVEYLCFISILINKNYIQRFEHFKIVEILIFLCLIKQVQVICRYNSNI